MVEDRQIAVLFYIGGKCERNIKTAGTLAFGMGYPAIKL